MFRERDNYPQKNQFQSPLSTPPSRKSSTSPRDKIRQRLRFRPPLRQSQRQRQSFSSPHKKPNPDVIHNSRRWKENNNNTPAAKSTQLGLFARLFQLLFNPERGHDTVDGCDLVDPPSRVEEPRQETFYSSDDEEESSYSQKIQKLRTKKSTWVDFLYRGLTFWGRGGFRSAVNDWVFKQLDPLKGEDYTYRGLGQGQRCYEADPVMTRLIDLSVTRVALLSRVMLLAIQIFANNLLDSVRHHNDGFRFEPEKGDGGKGWDPFVKSTLGGFGNWDGQYFLHIAVKGYTSEMTLAFFPLFPKTVSILAAPLHFLLGWHVSFSSLILVVSWILNTTLFVKTANMLYDLVGVAGVNVSPLPVVLLFCFNPASIFFSGMYTESMFMYLTMKVLLSLYDGKPYKSLFWAALSTLCRSNGILNFGFVAAYFLQDAFIRFRRHGKTAITFLISRGGICALFLSPFLAYQWYAISQFCKDELQPQPPYCRYEKLPYSYIQETYWNVGSFKYFQFKQLPNFILAAPVLYFQFTKNWRKLAPLIAKFCINPLGGVNMFSLYIAAHGVFLAMFCFIFIHVQVSTRLILSAFPYLYLFIVEACGDEVVAFRQRVIHWPLEVTCIQLWCAIYFIFGTIMFSLGYPWT